MGRDNNNSSQKPFTTIIRCLKPLYYVWNHSLGEKRKDSDIYALDKILKCIQ